MFAIIKNKITNEYNTIYQRDIENFKSLYNFFKVDPKLEEEVVPDFNFEIIDDLAEIKKILETDFISKGRGAQYNENLPSVTKIAYGLFPIDVDNEKFLLRWKNNHHLYKKSTEIDTDFVFQKGTFIHFILEQFVCDKSAREQDKPLIEQLKILQNAKKPVKNIIQKIDDKIIKDINKYINLAYEDEEILIKIPNIDEIKQDLEFLARNCLLSFIKEELLFTDLVYSEIFICLDDYIQGSIDFVAYKDNKFSIIDYKTTSSINKINGKPKFKSKSELAPYARQLYLYNELLKKSKMTHIYGEDPNYYIIQIHLLNGKYKKFSIPKELVKEQGVIIEKVIKWYWNTRKDIPTQDDIDYDNLEYISY